MWKFIKKRIENHKRDEDIHKGGKIIFLLDRFYSSERRKDFLLMMLIERGYFTLDDLEELGNTLGREVHMIKRKNNH